MVKSFDAWQQTCSRQSGMTLLELTVAVAIGSLILVVAGSLSLFTARSFEAMTNYADLDAHSQNALDVLSRDVREAKSVAYYSTNAMVFANPDGSLFAYIYSPSTKTLTRFDDGRSTVLLTGCDYLKFNISQRNPTNGVGFAFFPTSNPLTAKLIDVAWKCSRPIYGVSANTETIQTAKIVMRN